jgi:hypothetical protein
VAASYWSVPIRYGVLILAVGSRSKEQKRRGRGGLTDDAKSGEDVQKVDAELAPVVGDGEEDADAMQKGSANSKTWSVSLIPSCNALEGRLELGEGIGALGACLRQGFAEEKRPAIGQRERRGRGREGSKRGSAGCSTALLLMKIDGGLNEFQQGIPL